MDKLRTPDEAFFQIKNFNYSQHYMSNLPGFESLRLHFVDENRGNSKVFVCLHGQPTWSYLYRKMIPIFISTGARVIAPDFFGFGRSDKPIDDNAYTFDFHRKTLLEFLKKLDLENITLVCQDWGGILGFSLFPDLKDKITGLIIMNTLLPDGSFVSQGFDDWKHYNRSQDDLNIGKLIGRSDPAIQNEDLLAYDIPFPHRDFKGGVRRFPELMMDKPDSLGLREIQKATDFLSSSWNGDTFMAIGAKDPVIGVSMMERLRSKIRNCPKPLILKKAGHFVQERGDLVANSALNFWKQST